MLHCFVNANSAVRKPFVEDGIVSRLPRSRGEWCLWPCVFGPANPIYAP
jgi:hypothetical protein